MAPTTYNPHDRLISEIASSGTNNLINPRILSSGYPDPQTLPPHRLIELPYNTNTSQPVLQSVIDPRLQGPAQQIPPPALLQPTPSLPIPTPHAPVILPPTIPTIQPNPATHLKLAEFSLYAYPPYTFYPINPTLCHLFPTKPSRLPTATYPIQPQRPPILLPNHPIFTYWGRDLSDPRIPLPAHKNVELFVRMRGGDWSDHGFGQGVRVSEAYAEGVARAEEECMGSVVAWDVARMESGFY